MEQALYGEMQNVRAARMVQSARLEELEQRNAEINQQFGNLKIVEQQDAARAEEMLRKMFRFLL